MGNITDSIIKGDMRMKNIKEIGDLYSNHKVIFDYLFKSSYMPV